MRDLQKKVGDWHREAFPEDQYGDLQIESHVLEKIVEEAQELMGADFEDEQYEAADVAIALLAFCARRGIDLQSAIEYKMQINRGRVWTWDGEKFVRAK